MIRKAFRMAVHPGQEAEYERRHNPIWEELATVLRERGVASYSIYLDPADGSLFAYVEVKDEALWESVADTDVCRRWWRHMREVMPANDDDSPRSSPLREVFHLENTDPSSNVEPANRPETA
ncbi:MAG: L-rhamnose mutarotase [Gemmatimonadetes bacterium]|nr:L-rhamnose mutarotase [Gemmatimonadota bacterium]